MIVDAAAFPPHFKFGVATSAYQIEGAIDADGRGRSIWDTFCETPGAVERGESAAVACDHYHRMPEDVALLRDMGVSSYRFSIGWPRIQPTGKGPANAKGMAFYDRLVDELLRVGIRPFPTLYHWDLPQALEDAGGWPARDTATRFADYAALMATALGDRVQDWALFNEPFIFTSRGYLLGRYAPGKRDLGDFLRAVHTVSLAHGDGFHAIKAVRPQARVGSVFALAPCEPAVDTPADREAAVYADALFNRLFLDPLFHGTHPAEFLESVPENVLGQEPGDERRMRVPLDFIGVNCYYRLVVSAGGERPNLPFFLFSIRNDARTTGGHGDFSGRRATDPHENPYGNPYGTGLRIENAFGRDHGARTEMGWEIWPNALRDALLLLTERYGPIPIEVCESGCAFADVPDADGVVRDTARITYHQDHLAAVADAIAGGADVKSYHAWSLFDNFEWASGYRPRFGLVHVDYATQRRTLKSSGAWYRTLCQAARQRQA
ncbi:glycoside hydrolase family 1 protein [Gemmatimonas sp.]|uniref:glycoside hydrolase family 1 protein n=1 Tax=Gemmatimonas sp. TaxID=1962908 RepID=UPI00356B60A4